MATTTVPAAPSDDRRPPLLRPIDAERISMPLEKARAVMMLLGETQAEEDHITQIGQLMLELIAEAQGQLAEVTASAEALPEASGPDHVDRHQRGLRVHR